MADKKTMRLSQVARKLNVGTHTIVDFLVKNGFEVGSGPNTKLDSNQFSILSKEFAGSAVDKEEASELHIGIKHVEKVINQDLEITSEASADEEVLIKNMPESDPRAIQKEITPVHDNKADLPKNKLKGIKVIGKIDLQEKKSTPSKTTKLAKEEDEKEDKEYNKIDKLETIDSNLELKEDETKKENALENQDKQPLPTSPPIEEEKVISNDSGNEKKQNDKVIEAKAKKLQGLKVVGKIDLPKPKNLKSDPIASSDDKKQLKKKRPRKRVDLKTLAKTNNKPGGGRFKKKIEKEQPSDKDIQDKIKATLAKLSGGKKKGGVKYRKEKRTAISDAKNEKLLKEQEDSKVLKVAEFISANDLASLMNVSVNEVISACMGLGMFVSINQRLDAESITVIADEFNYNVDFTDASDEIDVHSQEVVDESKLVSRAPIVTIMGHVDHGKTSLLDYIRSSKVTDQEAGGITQHIKAYDVMTNSGNKIAFLDTPGHEAFTAMRSRGTKVTDIVIIVVAADDDVMPQTKEALNHAKVAGVPIIIAINKVDKPTANPEKIKESLSANNVLVEDWGGKYQCQEISAKTGQGIDELLEKVLLEAELLDLKASYESKASGTVVEASLDKGRGYVSTLLVQSGTLKIGDIILAGSYYGRVKAMFDHLGKKMDKAEPSTPILMLGLDGAPQAGDKFSVMESDREAREVALKREQILREQSIRTKKHITLDEIGRRLAIGSFKELNIIIKGDVDGSVEALSDSILKLSTDEIQVNIIHSGVGQISESDVLLASASDAVIIGFQVRPSSIAKKLANSEEIEIRLYSVIYDVINDVKDAMEGMLAPEVEEVIVGNVEIREVFKITKVGTVAGCMVTDGYVKKENPIRLIRDGIVVYSGEMGQLKRYKDDVTEVKSGYECGLSIKGVNDIKVGDVVESYVERELKRKL